MTIDPDDRTFDRLPNRDPQRFEWPIRAAIGDRVKRRNRMWRTGYKRLDQGREGACVLFGWTGELLGWPVPVKLADPNAFALSHYRPTQLIDEFSSTPPADGTSVDAGGKTMRQLGYIGSWRHAHGIDEVIDTLCSDVEDGGGPVIIGIDWHQTMGRPRPSGLVEVSGSVVGGHSVVLTGYMRATLYADRQYGVLDLVRFRNSWGADWGLDGSAWIRAEDLGRLLDNDGDAVVPQGRQLLVAA